MKMWTGRRTREGGYHTKGVSGPEGFVPVREHYPVPSPVYLITYRGEVVRVEAKAQDVREYLATKGHGWACLVNIDGEIREVCRNPVPSTRGGTE